MRDFVPARKRRSKKTKAKKSSGFSSRSKTTKKAAKPRKSSVSKKRKTVSRGRSRSSSDKSKHKKTGFLGKIFSVVLGFSIVIILGVIAAYVLSVSFFSLSEDRLVLFVGNDVNTPSGVNLVHFSPSGNKIRVIQLNEKIESELIGGYGEYQLGAIYPLLKIERKTDQSMLAVFSFALGTIIDDIIVVNEDFSELNQTTTRQVLFKAIGESQQPVSKKEAIGLWLYSIDNAVVWEQVDQSDADEVDSTSFLHIDSSLQECSIAVLNATSYSGLADKVGKIVADSGLFVVRTTNDDQKRVVSQIFYDPETDCESVANTLAKVLPKPLITADHEQAQRSRANVVISLGRDLEL